MGRAVVINSTSGAFVRLFGFVSKLFVETIMTGLFGSQSIREAKGGGVLQ